MVFVFGSNEAGRHGAGAALFAVRNHKAVYGRGSGLQGDAYAIPTKDKGLRSLPLEAIQAYVDRFKDYARENSLYVFQVTRIGCGLAGYKDEQIYPMFLGSPANCLFPPEWSKFGFETWEAA